MLIDRVSIVATILLLLLPHHGRVSAVVYTPKVDFLADLRPTGGVATDPDDDKRCIADDNSVVRDRTELYRLVLLIFLSLCLSRLAPSLSSIHPSKSDTGKILFIVWALLCAEQYRSNWIHHQLSQRTELCKDTSYVE